MVDACLGCMKPWAWCLIPVITYPHSEKYKVIQLHSQLEASLGYMGPCFILRAQQPCAAVVALLDCTAVGTVISRTVVWPQWMC